jgi:hypothetical protein
VIGTNVAAVGCRSHSGWAVLVAIAGSATAPEVLHRVRIELLDGALPAHPYHEAAEGGMSLQDASSLIRKVEVCAAKRASVSLAALIGDVEQGRMQVAGVAVVTTDRAIPDELERVLRSHQLLHAAEGDLFEEALVEGASSLGGPVARVALPSVISPKVEVLRRTVGSPWQKDHKLAAMAALTLLP